VREQTTAHVGTAAPTAILPVGEAGKKQSDGGCFSYRLSAVPKELYGNAKRLDAIHFAS
jgi:hypothetical protein